jgi:ubiquinone/menaquinone biosynthesis C-methylase UbiE
MDALVTRHEVESAYDAIAPRYDHAFNSRRCHVEDRQLAGRLNRFLRGVEGDVLDVGCGTGAFLRLTHWRADRYTGVDVSAGMLTEAITDHPDATFIHASVEGMPLPSEYFEAVVSAFSALSYVAAPLRALQEIRRVLLPGGHCFLMVCAPRWYRRNAPCAGDLHLHLAPHAWSRWQAHERCKLAGFDDIKLSAFSILPTPLMALDTWLARRAEAGRYLIIEATRA